MSSPNNFTVEVCVDQTESAIAATENGASRLELCAAISEGGITPPMSLLQQVIASTPLPVHMMVRPRGGDFLYSSKEYDRMKHDIVHAAGAGATGVVFGILRDDGSVDMERCRRLVQLSRSMHITFHRAFDMTSDPYTALEEIISLGVDTILTSGHRRTVTDGMEVIRELVKRADNRIDIMAGGGVNKMSAYLLYKAGIRSFHFTARKSVADIMKYRNPSLPSLTGGVECDQYEFDSEKMQAIIKTLTQTACNGY